MPDELLIGKALMDESFDLREVRNYGVAAVISQRGFDCTILDLKRNKFIGLHRVIRKEGMDPDYSEFLEGVHALLPWLKSPFSMVRVAWDGGKSTLIPESLFHHDGAELYLSYNHEILPGEKVSSDHLMMLDAWQVYAVPSGLTDAMTRFYPQSRLVHSASLLIESIWINYKNRIVTPHLFLNIREPWFDLMIFDGKRMSYFNTFRFVSAEDVTYYLVFVLEQLGFNPEKIPLVLFGNVREEDELSVLLNRYIRQVSFGLRNEAYRYSYVMNQLPRHSYFPLLNFFSCGL